jgi:hypothetical protein
VGNDVEIETIDHLDFDIELPCEHSQHDIFHPADQPASWHVQFSACPNCGDQSEKSRNGYLICDEGRRIFFKLGAVKCTECRTDVPIGDWKCVFTPLNA